MSAVPRSCFLNPFVIERDQIQLPHEEIVIIDCNEIFPDVVEIADLKLFAMANCNTGCVIIQSMGLVPCRNKGRVLTRGAKYLFGPGNVIQLNDIKWEYEYEVCFNPPMPDYVLHLDLPRLFERTQIDPQYSTSYAQATWQSYDNQKVLVYTSYLLNHSSGVIGFSLEDVIVKKDTWIFKYDNIEKRLKTLYDKKFKIVIFINQTRLKGLSIAVYKKKLEKFLSKFSVPVQVFISLGETKYKQPVPCMWHVMAETFNENLIIEPDRCCYIGSSSNLTDILFAANIEIKFFSSEQYFKLRVPVSLPQMPDFNPKQQINNPIFTFNVSAVQEIVVMVGRPCSGKTSFYNNYLRNYHYHYIIGSIQHTTAKLTKFLKTYRKSVIIDDRNPSKRIRQKYIEIAKKFNVPCRCFVMDTTREQARHINRLREITCSKKLQNLDNLLDAFEAVYEYPKLSEGFSKIVHVPFVPRYKSSEKNSLYQYYLLSN